MTTWSTATARLAGFGIAAFALTAVPVSAAPAGNDTTYLIQTVIENAQGSMTANEVLRIASTNGRAAVTVTQQNSGQRAHVVAAIDDDGLVNLATDDPAITCYNTAQSILAGSGKAQPATALNVSLAGNAFSIPLRLTPVVSVASTRSTVQTYSISGAVEGTFDAQPQMAIGIVVDGNVRTLEHQLVSVRLNETTMLAATREPIGRTSCSIARITGTESAVTI